MPASNFSLPNGLVSGTISELLAWGSELSTDLSPPNWISWFKLASGGIAEGSTCVVGTFSFTLGDSSTIFFLSH